MVHRFPLLAAVVGVLLVGGATTGTTYASWHDQASLTAHTVRSGTMSLAGVQAPSTLTVARGQSGTSTVTVTDSSSAAAKNLVQRITPSVATTPGSATGVAASLTTRSAGGSCTTTSQGAVLTSAGESFAFCVNVSASSASTATTATVTVTLNGAQVRHGNPQGWTRVQTVTIPVTIAPSAPDLTCAEVGNDVRVTWNKVSGETYRAEISPNGSSPWMAVGEVTSPYLATDVLYTPTFARVLATNAAGTSSGWSTLRLTRSGNGKIRCGQELP